MQLLTADTMQNLIEFSNIINYDITIKENSIYIEFACGKMFEPTQFNKFSLDRDTLYRYYEILDFVLTFSNKMVQLLYETKYN